MRRVSLVLASAIALLVAGAACLAPARSAVQTARLLPALFGDRAGPPFAEPITESTLLLDGAHPGATLHIYRPLNGRHPALAVSLGIEPAPPNDPRVVSLLGGLAKDGYVAALVESPDLDAGRLTTDAPDLLVSAVEHLAGQPYVQPDHIALIGLSVGGSLALIAAADPRIAGQLRLVEAVGAYDNLITLSRAVLLNTVKKGIVVRPWRPAPLAEQAVRANLTALLDPQSAQAVLSAQTVSGFDAAIADLSSGDRQQLDTLSPEPHLGQIRVPVYLMVDKGDTFVPPEESAAIAARLHSTRQLAYFSSFDILQHVEPGTAYPAPLLARDLLVLFLHVCSLLRRL